MQAWLIWIRKHTFTSLSAAILFMALAPASVFAQQPPPRPGDPGPRPPIPPPSITEPGTSNPNPGTSNPGTSSTSPYVQPASPASSGVGQIHLATTPGALTVVQWQDGSGNWNDVTSWRAVATSGSVVWTVDPKDFGTGPFRWAVYASDGYRIAGVSGTFNLPGAGQTVSVSASGGYTEPPQSHGSYQPYGGVTAYQKPLYQPPAYGTGGYSYNESGYQQPQYEYGNSYGYGNSYPYYRNYQTYPYNYGNYGYNGYAQQYTYRYRAYNTTCWCYTQGVWYYVCGH